MIYGSWDMEWNGHNILSFGNIFCPLTTPQKTKIIEKMKNMPGDIIILHKCTKNHDHKIIRSTVLEISCGVDVIFIFDFGLFFALLTP